MAVGSASVTPELEVQICDEYLNQRASSKRLQRKHGIGQATVSKVLQKHGITPRGPSQAARRYSPETERKVCTAYQAGESLACVGKTYGLSAPGVRNILRRNGVKCRKQGLTSQQEKGVVKSYTEQQASISQLACAFNVQRETIRAALKQQNIQIRDNSEAQGGINKELYLEIASRYLDDEDSTVNLAQAYGVSPTAITTVLLRQGISLRLPGWNLGETVDHAISSQGKFSRQLETALYVCTVTGCDGFLKLGITSNLDGRRRAGRGRYGEVVYLQYFETRLSAYFLEQALLFATLAQAECPSVLADERWPGLTEIRRLHDCEALEIVDLYVNQMEDLGVWDFAAAHVPMSATQKAECQRRASIA
jgi:transposase-like protein